MIKWAVELWKPNVERRDCTDSDFNFVGQSIWDATSKLVRPKQLSIFMRRMAFQQIWYQRPFDVGAIPRQAVLFGELMAESDVVQKFFASDGIGPGDFVRQLAHLACQFGDRLGLPELSLFRPKSRLDDAEKWQRMAQSLVVDLPQLHKRMTRLAKYATPREVEICEQTPLIRTPFLQTHQGAKCIHHKILFQTLAVALYDVLRERGPEVFMREFGPAFEAYVGQVLKEVPYTIISEHELQKQLIGQGKCVDFTVVSDDTLLLVDAKGIEGHYDELYHNLSEVLTEKLRTTALHAADQAVDTVRRLPNSLRRPLIVFVCVTYKQLNIGNGEALRNLTSGTAEWDADRWHETNLPASNMFTVSISEFESLCRVMGSGVPVADIFQQIFTDNALPETRKFLFEQHMEKYVPPGVPVFASEAASRLFAAE
jgi:hypothetical protein